MSGQVQVVSLNCLKCGAALEITQSITQFSCGYCGAAQMVQRSGGIVALSLVTEAIEKVRVGTDKTAAELAINRIQGEIQYLSQQWHMLMGRWQVEKNRISSSISTSVLVIILITFFIWIGVLVSNQGNSDALIENVIATVFCWGAAIAVFIFILKAKNRDRKNLDERFNPQKTHLENLIADANRRLQEQIRIVNS